MKYITRLSDEDLQTLICDFICKMQGFYQCDSIKTIVRDGYKGVFCKYEMGRRVKNILNFRDFTFLSCDGLTLEDDERTEIIKEQHKIFVGFMAKRFGSEYLEEYKKYWINEYNEEYDKRKDQKIENLTQFVNNFNPILNENKDAGIKH